GKTRPRKDGRLPRSFKLLIKPSAEAAKRHHQALRAVVRGHKAASQTAVLMALNPVIRGWAAYYRTVVSKEVFASCDYHLMSTLKHWMGRRHGSDQLAAPAWPLPRSEIGARRVSHSPVPSRSSCQEPRDRGAECRESGTFGFADESFPRGTGLVQHTNVDTGGEFKRGGCH